MWNWNNNFIDTVNVLDFLISIKNLQENTAQTDQQNFEEQINEKIQLALKEIHSHLQEQDKKIDLIMKKLGVQ